MTQTLEPIAVIGLAGRFPGACNVEQFWLNLREGRDSVSRLTEDELLAAGVPAALLADPSYVRAFPQVPDFDQFDAKLFGFTPRDALLRDPQQRLFLETAHAALENAGYCANGSAGSVGVFGGASANHYAEFYLRNNPRLLDSVDGLTLDITNNNDYVATIVSYKLGLRGPSMTVATACSTSLVAVHLACNALRAGECDAALAGAVEIELPLNYGYLWRPGSIYARDGRCRPFDSGATGTIFGNGVGVVVLKRLTDAVNDGDSVRAVIRGSAINNDGSDKVSFGAPSVSGQTAAIVEAMAMAGVSPDQIGYVEAHGTGTALGDPIEVAALTKAYRAIASAELDPGTCPIGSVKSNVGHLGPAAGIVALIKVVLAMENEQIPPTVNFTAPNPKLELESTPFYVNDKLMPWSRKAERPRVAAISSFGVGGTNAHLVLEEAPAAAPMPDAGTSETSRPRLLVWSALGRQQEDALRDSLSRSFTWNSSAVLADVAYTLQVGRTHHPVRAAAVCDSAKDAAAMLADSGHPRIVRRDTARHGRQLALVFPGQGSQHVGMAAGLYGVVAPFTESMDHCLSLLADGDVDLRGQWLGESQDSAIDDTAIAQPLLFCVEYSLAEMWRSWGMRPDAVLGHSIGELVAATIAGVVDVESSLRLVAARARHMRDMPAGSMLAVNVPESDVQEYLGGQLAVGVTNSPRQVVISGPADEVGDLEQRLAADGVACQRLRTSHAFHSPLMAVAAERFDDDFAGVELRRPTIRMISAATGRDLTDEQASSSRFWSRQIVDPVRFDRALDELLSSGDWLLLECGPEQALTSVMRQHPAVVRGGTAAIPTLPRAHGRGEGDDLRRTLEALGRIFVEGHDVDWRTVNAAERRRRVPVPGYPYQRERFWPDPPEELPETESTAAESGPAAVAAAPAAIDPQASAAPSPYAVVSWVEEPSLAATPQRLTGLALLPADPNASTAVLSALYRAGLQVLRVRPGDALHLGEEEFVVRPDEPADLAAVVAELRSRGVDPELYIHAWTLPRWDLPSPRNYEEQLALAFTSLLTLMRDGPRYPVNGRLPGLLVLTAHAVDVSGSEPVEPMKAMTLGLTRTWPEESPGAPCKLVDLGSEADEQLLVDELCRWRESGTVALRKSRRWRPVELCYAARPALTPALRSNGVYVITGGLGALGLEVAKGIARSGLRPKLALLGRRGLPEAGSPTARSDAAEVRARLRLAEMEAMGAQARAFTCDITDPRQLRRTLDIIRSQFGEINGVVHAAGVAGGGVIQRRVLDDALGVVQPKVLGTLLLEEYLAERTRLDFFVSFSSRAATGGLLGSGDYAAANAFLDGHAQSRPADLGRALSIGWPSWRGAGMAAAGAQPRIAGQGTAAALKAGSSNGDPVDWEVAWDEVMGTDTHWVLDEHRFGTYPVLPGAAYIDLVLRAARADRLPLPAGMVRLEGVAFLKPMVASTQRQVQLVVRSARGNLEFRVRSMPHDGDHGTWVDHVLGRIVNASDSERTLDLAETELRIGSASPQWSAGNESNFVTLGPRWTDTARVLSGDREDLAVLQLPDAFVDDIADHVLHPALLDVATAIVAAQHDGSYLPLMYDSVDVHASLPARFYSHVRYRQAPPKSVVADIDLLAEDGTVLVEITGFTMRQTDRASFMENLGGVSPEDAFAALEAAEARPSQVTSADDEEGIDPDVGVGLFLDLLGSSSPAHVLVRPYMRGCPVPIQEAPDVALRAPVSSRITTVASMQTVPSPAAPASPADGDAPLSSTTADTQAGGLAPAKSVIIEELIRSFWTEALGIEGVSDDDDFFDLGGNSLSAIQLMSRIRENFDVELSVGLLFEFPTVSTLSQAVREQQNS